MLRNYVIIAWRTLRKRSATTAINVIGLAVGVAACLLIGLWVQQELSYDTFHPDAERIHRILVDTEAGANAIYAPQGPAPLKTVLREQVPEVEAVTQFRPHRSAVLHRDDQAFTDHTVVHTDSAFLDVFGGFTLLHGDRATALDGTRAILLTATTAERLFGRTDVVGETVRLDDTDRSVTGVLADVPETSHVQFDAVTVASVPASFQDNWTGFRYFTYAKLTEAASVTAFEEKLSAIATTHGAADVADRFNFPDDEISYALLAEPLPAIHLYSDFNSLDAGGSIATVYVFGAVGLFILLIACVNFMNLATARASERATEVGVRKALGAGRTQLAGQFLGEAVLTTTLATGVAVLLAIMALPVFNELADTSFEASAFLHPTVVLGGLVLVLIVGLVSGSYPAFALSRFIPAVVLKAGGRSSSSGPGRSLRQGLVVVQFAISITLIVGTLVAQEQFDYIQTKRLGLDKERVVAIEHADGLGPRQATFVDRVRQLSGVTSASAGEGIFGPTSVNAFWPADTVSTASQVLRLLQVGPRFIETMGIEVAEGRTFDPARPADSMAVIVNEAAATAFGWGQPTQERLAHADTSTAVYDVIGVVENFHFQSMWREVEPVAIFTRAPQEAGVRTQPSKVYARLAPGDLSTALEAIRATWTDVAGGTAPFQYAFLDETYDQLHRDVQHAGRLISLFAGLAILIACLGLFGLATYTVQRRAKEIGIRKALGATATQIVGLLSKQFIRLVALAAVVALPVAYWATQHWLQDFAYRTSVGIGTLMGATVIAGVVAFFAIGYQALRAARLSPALTLKDE